MGLAAVLPIHTRLISGDTGTLSENDNPPDHLFKGYDMGINVNNAPKGGKNIPTLEAGAYPARIVGCIDLGMQPQEYEGEVKAPCNEVMMTYELSDEFLKDKDGNDMPDKPRWFSERFAVKNIGSAKAKSTLRYNAIDPKGQAKGDFSKTIGFPVMVTLAEQEGTGKYAGIMQNKISALSVMREKEAAKLPELVNPPLVFLMDAPDMEAWKRIPEWVQDRIVNSLQFAGSKLEALLGGSSTTQPHKDSAPAPDDSNPF